MKPSYRLAFVLSFFFVLFLSGTALSQQLNWASKIGGTGADQSNAVYTDNADNVYIAGKFSGSNIDFDPSPTTTFLMSSAGSTDAFVAKYSATGAFIWAFRYGGADRDEVYDLAFDQSNNLYLTGYFRTGNVDFDPGPGVANLSSNGEGSADPGWGGDIVVAKYNQAGQYQWAFNVGSTQTGDYGLCITADPTGNVYVGGRFDGQMDFDPGSGSTVLNSGTGGPIFLAKYNTAGAFQWAFNVGLANNDNAVFGLRADNAGNVYATGFFQGTNIDFDPGAGVAGLSSAGGYEAFLAKYNTNGQYQWAFRIGGGGLDTGRDLTLDNAGNVYLIGDFNGSNIDFDPSTATAALSSNGSSDVFLAKYNSNGQYQWAFNFGGTSGDIGWWVTTDNDHLFITGGFTGTADLNPSPTAIDNLVSAGGYDIFLGKYTLNGEYLCSFKVGGTGDDFGYSIVSNSNNVFYLSGSFQGANIDFDPTAATSNLSSAGSDDIFLAKYTWPDNTTLPAGTLTGSTICAGNQAQLTFTATAGTGPFTIVYNNGSSNITQTNVQSGVPFTVTPAPVVNTTYTLVSVRDAQRCSESNFLTGVSALVTVNNCAPPVPCNTWFHAANNGDKITVGDLDITGNKITVEALVVRTEPLPSPTGMGHVVSKHTTFTDANYTLFLDGCEITTDVSGYKILRPACRPELNRLYHVAMVYDGTTLKFYQNGYLMAETPCTGNMINNNLLTTIAQVASNTDPLLNESFGYINEVRIWNVARTQNEIKMYMYTTLPNPTTQVGLKGYYTFDNLLNKQGNPAYNGTLVAGTINQTNPNCTFVADSCYRTADCTDWLYTPSQGAKMTIGDVDITGNQLTVEAMFNRTQPLNSGLYYGRLVSKHTDQTNVNYGLLPNGCEITTANGYKSTFQTCPLELNKTYHVAMVYDGTTLKYYQNGFLMSQTPCTGNLVTNNLLATIGQVAASSPVANEQFLGYINEVRIWNVARTQDQLRTFMNSSLPYPATQTGLRAYYTLDNVTNDQGNAAYNGLLVGGAVINQTNPQCTFTADSCRTTAPVNVTADFTIPATVCVNSPVTISNTSQNATSYYWSFCAADPTISPVGTNLGNPGSSLVSPVYSELVKANGNYYLFVVNHWPGGLVRLDFGNSYLNTPTAVSLGNVGGIIPNSVEGIRVIYNNGHWLALVVAGSPPNSIPSRIMKIDFGSDITNTSPVGTNWGNVGGLNLPHELHMFQEGAIWYGLVVNAQDNTVTRINFTGDLVNNTPTGVNLGTFSGLNYPTGINAVNDNGNWHVFITSDNDNPNLVRLDFGTSLLNTPASVNLGNPGGMLKKTRDISILKDCGQINAYAINGFGVNQLLRLNFGASITSVPVITNLGNTGGMNFPHSISQIFRVGNDLYTFIPNNSNNTITRIRIPGCTSSSLPNAAVQNPAPVTYSTPGTYNITLTIDDGLPTQATVCRQVTVTDCAPIVINQYTDVLAFDGCKNSLTVSDATAFNAGDTVLMIQMKGAVIDATNTAAFGTVTDYRNAGNYEYNYVKSKTGNEVELLNIVKRSYSIPDGKVQLVRVPYFQDYDVTRKLTCAPWDGNKGGVLAFNVQHTLTLTSDIDVSGKGFRGGADANNLTGNVSCSENNYTYPLGSKLAAPKGESIADVPDNIIKGRGAPASGGGGGQEHNSGGGGGGNGGVGGFGGNQFASCTPPTPLFDNRGMPGRSLGYSNAANKVFLGGGGGAGHANDAAVPGAGGRGGGIAIISCENLNANVFAILSNGETPAHVMLPANEDGRNGGGAGGTILLNYNTASGVINTAVRGGNGDYNAPPPGTLQHGPGGGGGGGIVWVNKPVLGSAFAVSLQGGINGVNTTLSNDPWGAMPGNRGDTLGGLVIPVADVPFKKNIDSVRIRNTVTACSHFDFEGLGYVNAAPVVAWQWYIDGTPGASTQNTSHTFTTSGNHDVKLVITDANGCKDSILVNVQGTAPDFDFTYSRDVCDPLTVQFTGIGASTANPYWIFGDGNTATGVLTTSHTYAATGNYTVRYSAGNGVCTDTLDKTISVDVLRDNIVLTRDTTICYGTTKQLLAVPSLDFCWSPATYLDNPNSPQPVTSATEDITYYLTSEVTGTNLIVNGDFTQGNTGFTSAYNFANPNTTEGQYFIGTNPRAWNGNLDACSDHTTGTGNMMLVNGAPAVDVNVWKQTVTVVPNTNYAFSTWILGAASLNPARLQFSINGNIISTQISASALRCTWVQYYTTWNSGNSTTAVISIVNKNTVQLGNDFALDDISFAPVFIKRDSVKITVEKPLVKTNNDTTVCTKSPVQLIAAGAQDYVWSPATALTDPSVFNPVASPEDTTRYIVTGTTINGCVAKDTVYVNVFGKPDIKTTDDATICKNTSVPLSATGGVSYSWFPAATLAGAGTANPVATPAGDMTYYVTVTDMHDCAYLDSVKIAIRADAVFTANGAGSVCKEDSLQLSAGGGDSYSWRPATGLSNAAIANPKASPAATTDYIVTITESVCHQTKDLPVKVTILPLPDVQATRSNDIDCSYGESQLRATGAGTYIWTPSRGLSSTVIANPVATPDITTSYVVAGTNTNGCKNRDTVVVKVEAANKGDYLMPNAFTPNNDGLNDCYGVKLWGVVEELEFSIYNRWGELIFFTKDPGQCWDGTYKGVKQNSAVFVYMIRARTNCESKVFRKGTFVLIR